MNKKQDVLPCALFPAGADPLARDPRRGLTAAQWAHLCSWPGCARVLEAHALRSDFSLRINSVHVPNSVTVTKSITVSHSVPVPNLLTVPNSSSSSDPGVSSEFVLDSCLDYVPDSVQDSVPESRPIFDPDSDTIQDPTLNSDPDPGSESVLESVPGPESSPDSDSVVQCRLLRWFSESDLSQESSWLRERHTNLTGGAGRRASLPDRPDIYRPVEPATWRTVCEIPSIRVLEVEAPVDPVIVQYGDPVPPDQRTIQQNKVGV